MGNVIKSRENDDVTKLNRGEAGGPVSCCSLGCGSNVDRLGLRGSPPRGYVQLYAAALTSGEGFQPEEDRKGLSCSLLLFLEPHPPGFSLSAASFLLIFLRFAPGVFPAIPSPSWHCPSLVTLIVLPMSSRNILAPDGELLGLRDHLVLSLVSQSRPRLPGCRMTD